MTEPDPGPIDIDPDASRIRVLWWIAVALLCVGLGACVAKGADRPADPSLEGALQALAATFDTVGFRVVPGDGAATTTERCAWQADTDAERAQGLMEITDRRLGGKDGMVFRFDVDTGGGFHMRNTRIALTAAFFSGSGEFLAARDMPPCPDDVDPCPSYGPGQPYRTALEVPQGRLGALGIGPGVRLELGGPCAG